MGKDDSEGSMQRNLVEATSRRNEQGGVFYKGALYL
jgi:hypothetical protein